MTRSVLDELSRLAARDTAPIRPGVLAESAPAAARSADLTAREIEVLGLVADGLTDGQIADRLSLSARTVGQHLRSVYNKFEVSSRAAATRCAIERGIV